MDAAMNQLLTNRQPSAELLDNHRHSHDYALVMFDREGCGAEDKPRETIQSELEQKLYNSGWENRSKVIVIDPELEAWVWTDSPHTARLLGWKEEGYSELRTWLRDRELWPVDYLKPSDPKEAFLSALRAKGLQRSPKRFEKLAKVVGLKKCQDPAFLELAQTLAEWFPRTPP